ncbi:MAG: Gfo/Idh/MocA family oxidoreductase [Rhodospirillales bacterium]|nr:Gfo/Idh/MocA family oxidoreductase [Rhodospirillales bacterium]
MKALVVGYGSIGARHVSLLEKLGLQVAVVSRRAVPIQNLFTSIGAALEKWAPDYVVIASRTIEHREDVEMLATAGFTGTVLIEKPIFQDVREIPKNLFNKIFVAYNLRFHPVIWDFKDLIGKGEVFAINSVVGQHLEGWRPQSDYRASYSASWAQGGGVLNDLSHELDFLCWMLGGWNHVTAAGGKHSNLEIDSDDIFSVLMETPGCPVVNVHMNYLSSPPRREITAFTERGTIEANLLTGILSINGKLKKYKQDRDDTYLKMHEAVLQANTTNLCSVRDALNVKLLIDAIEKAAASHAWVAR